MYLAFKLFLNHYRFRYGFDIPVGTQLGPGLYLGHFGRITINPKAILGSNINLSPGVTIGETYRGTNRGVPVINDGVWIGTNAVVVGKIVVGRNVLIAPNTFLNFDVPDNSVVMGNPASIISTNGANGYVSNAVDLDINGRSFPDLNTRSDRGV
jgi:serine O-acetyltransferase